MSELPAGEGHFTAPAAEAPPVRPDPPPYSAEFEALGRDPPTLQERMQMFRTKAGAIAKMATDKAAQTTEQLRKKAQEKDWTKETEYLGRAQMAAAGAAEKASTWVWTTSSRTASALKGDAVSTLARTEATTRPCPRVVLVCCSALVSSALDEPGIFREPASDEIVQFLLNSFEDGFGVFLPPPGTSPHTLAALLLHFCFTLPEPLLTFKTLPSVIAAGEISADTAALSPPLLMELPAANLNALWVLLEMLSRVASNAAVNEMDARALAQAFAPKLAWLAPPKATKAISYSPMGDGNGLDELESEPSTPVPTDRAELTEEETASVARVLQYYITNFQALNRRVYWTPSGQPALLPD